jgi:hypothetical protein
VDRDASTKVMVVVDTRVEAEDPEARAGGAAATAAESKRLQTTALTSAAPRIPHLLPPDRDVMVAHAWVRVPCSNV